MFRTYVPLTVKGKDVGSFDICDSYDEEYPGLDIELLLNDEEADAHITRPRIKFEYNEELGLRMLIWADRDSEDYTDEIIFDADTELINKILKK